MKILLTITALIALSLTLSAEPVTVADTKVTFDAPEGFKPLSKEIIDVKWPTNRAPAYAIGTPTGSTTIAYDLKPNTMPQEALPEVQKSFTRLFARIIPGIEWKKNEIIEHSGQKWLLMEMTSNATDTDIYNIMLVTGFKGKMLMFNFNSTKEEFPKYEAILRKSLKSIKLREKQANRPPSLCKPSDFADDKLGNPDRENSHSVKPLGWLSGEGAATPTHPDPPLG